MLSKKASSTIFRVFGMTWTGVSGTIGEHSTHYANKPVVSCLKTYLALHFACGMWQRVWVNICSNSRMSIGLLILFLTYLICWCSCRYLVLTFAFTNSYWLIYWLVGFVLWHVNSCRLFNAKSYLYTFILLVNE